MNKHAKGMLFNRVRSISKPALAGPSSRLKYDRGTPVPRGAGPQAQNFQATPSQSIKIPVTTAMTVAPIPSPSLKTTSAVPNRVSSHCMGRLLLMIYRRQAATPYVTLQATKRPLAFETASALARQPIPHRTSSMASETVASLKAHRLLSQIYPAFSLLMETSTKPVGDFSLMGYLSPWWLPGRLFYIYDHTTKRQARAARRMAGTP